MKRVILHVLSWLVFFSAAEGMFSAVLFMDGIHHPHQVQVCIAASGMVMLAAAVAAIVTRNPNKSHYW